MPVRLLVDMPLIPEKTFVALNLSYSPTFARIGGTWQQQNPVEITLAATTAIPGNAFLGLEIRQLTLNQHGFFSGRALWAQFVCQAVRRDHRQGGVGGADPG
jgi:hypothetical protein